MQKIEEYRGFEQGPIRPPSEAESLLIRITRNCPWNKCTFCPVYKDAKFTLRPTDHVIRDIDTVAKYVNLILESKKSGEKLTRRQLRNANVDEDEELRGFHAAYNFISGGMKSIFLQDGNSLIVKPKEIVRILAYLKTTFPMVERITSYARSHTIARISDENLQEMAETGLNRIHIGMESGSDAVLSLVKKGSDKKTQVVAGQKVKRAGIQLSEYFMPGLGGKTLSKDNALESADALNQINPDFIRLRTLAMPTAAPLTKQFNAGEFDKMGEVGTAEELLLFLENLDGIESKIRSDHVLNLFQEVHGDLPQDKEKMMQPIRDFLALDPEEQLIFCIGRRTHRISRLEYLGDEVQRYHAKQMCQELGATVDNMDEVIDAVMQRFI